MSQTSFRVIYRIGMAKGSNDTESPGIWERENHGAIAWRSSTREDGGATIQWEMDKWAVSSFNGEVPRTIRPDVFIVDCTLREGEQQAGIVLSRKQKIKIAHLLDEIGIPQLEVGMPAVSAEEEGNIKAIAQEGLKAKLIAVCRSLKEDVDKAERCGVWGGELQPSHWSTPDSLQTEMAEGEGHRDCCQHHFVCPRKGVLCRAEPL